MKVSVIQMDMRLADPAFNFSHAGKLIRKAAAEKPDVIVLPETWNTGFFPKERLASFCDENGAETVWRIGALAAEFSVNIVAGSVSDRRDGGIYNTAFVFDRGGACIAQYDKTHLFTPSGEQESYRRGGRLCTFTLDGHPCGLIICYDVRFPELARTLALTGIEVLFIPAQWPALRRFHWDMLVTARAIENQLFVVACNSCAADTKEAGSSRVLDPWGAVLAEADDRETILTAELDFSVIEQIRSSINVYRDRRPELYSI